MPYLHHAHYLPEWEREAPEPWIKRLREISGVTDKMSHLVFRWFDKGHETWKHPEVGMWSLYTAIPKALVPQIRAELFDTHWSEMGTDGEKEARKNSVSSYQHFMWHTRGVDVFPFLLLQGPFGGTPARYTRREKRILDAEDAWSEPFELGDFPPCPFDEKTIERIVERDKFLQSDKNLDRMQTMDRPEWQKVLDEEAERAHRERFLAKWYETTMPQADYLRHFMRKKEAERALRPAPEGLSAALAQWKDHYIEHGTVIGAKVARSRKVHVAVR